MKNQVIQIYLLVCQIYDNHCSLKYQRDSNFKPVFTDEELITVYLFGQLNERFNHRQIHQFIREYWRDWFPDLPSYQAFNRRLNLLADNFQELFAYLLHRSTMTTNTKVSGQGNCAVFYIDPPELSPPGLETLKVIASTQDFPGKMLEQPAIAKGVRGPSLSQLIRQAATGARTNTMRINVSDLAIKNVDFVIVPKSSTQ